MEGLGEFICESCNMAFHSVGLLNKHKAKFCIGTDLKDPVGAWRGRVGRTKTVNLSGKTMHPTKARTPDLIILKEQSHPADQRESQPDKPQDSLLKDNALSKLTEEFQKLRMSIEESLPRKQTEQVLLQQKADEQRALQLSKLHEKRLAEIRAHNHQLEKEREEIEQRLVELAGRDRSFHLEEALHELRYQEQRNEEVLHKLSYHINSIKVPNPNEVPSNPPPVDPKTQHINFNLISSVDGPLSSQIRALRLGYMQSGGSDPEVLAHMHDLQAEALTLEQARPKADGRTKGRRMKSPQRVFDPDVLAVEQENLKLEEEIFRIQLARERHKGLKVIQKDPVHHMASLQAEIAYLRGELEKGRERRPPPTPPTSPLFPGSSLARTHPALSLVTDPMEPLGPALYDPVAGFVIFYDLVIGIEATLKSVCLLAGLYCNGQKLGQITPMPPVQCLPSGPLWYPSTRNPGNYAILAMKQHVPRIQPSPYLSLIVEIHTSGGLDFHNHGIGGLVPQGWATLELFDQHDQIHSGHWRLPVLSLPVRGSLNPDQLSSVPQLGNMQLCVRIVNARDEDAQSLLKIDLKHISQYNYPPTVVSNTSTIPETHDLYHKLQPSANPVPSSMPLMDHVDQHALEFS
ncbi:coiled-coil domain-containing protein 17 [Misgurnus anguillicaudatus]|uniref:coiled-coil domain-containing protein 17 n=1 Tax=Misgurnus anguillicaudatus TaxID=75329 RepID=UPI003CCF3E0C